MNDYNENIIRIGILSINLFEDKLYSISQTKEKIKYENIRKKYFAKNYGPKIDKNFKKEIINTLKKYTIFKNDIYLLFLFSFPAYDINKYKKENNEFVFLFKQNDKIYIIYRYHSFELNYHKKKLETTKLPSINLFDLSNDINFNENEFELSDLQGLDKNPIIYLYKIYYLGNSLIY